MTAKILEVGEENGQQQVKYPTHWRNTVSNGSLSPPTPSSVSWCLSTLISLVLVWQAFANSSRLLLSTYPVPLCTRHSARPGRSWACSAPLCLSETGNPPGRCGRMRPRLGKRPAPFYGEKGTLFICSSVLGPHSCGLLTRVSISIRHLVWVSTKCDGFIFDSDSIHPDSLRNSWMKEQNV